MSRPTRLPRYMRPLRLSTSSMTCEKVSAVLRRLFAMVSVAAIPITVSVPGAVCYGFRKERHGKHILDSRHRSLCRRLLPLHVHMLSCLENGVFAQSLDIIAILLFQ